MLRSGFMEQVKSGALSRMAKAWKHEAERIAENAGRDGKPIVAIQDDLLFGARTVPSSWLGERAELDGIPIQFVKSEAMSALPWAPSV